MTDYWSKLKVNECWSEKEQYNFILNYLDSKIENSTENNNQVPLQEEDDNTTIESGNIIVTITDKENNEGISGALVTVHNDDETVNLTGTTDDEGNCTISDVPYGEYTIGVEHDDYIGDVDIVTVDDSEILFNMNIESI